MNRGMRVLQTLALPLGYVTEPSVRWLVYYMKRPLSSAKPYFLPLFFCWPPQTAAMREKRRPAGRRLHLFGIRQDAQQHQLIRAGVVDAVGVSLRAVVGHACGDGCVRAVVVAYAAAG